VTAIVWNGPEELRPLLVPIADLEPWPGNPRHGDVDAIAGSLKRFGQPKPIVVDPMVNGLGNPRRIVAGHHVVLAALEQTPPWTHVSAVSNEFGSENEARAFLLADNRTAELGTISDLDLDAQLQELRDSLEGTGYDPAFRSRLHAKLERLRREQRASEDDVPDLPAEPVTKPGEIFELGPHKLICGDSTSPAHIESLMRDEWTKLIFTSPPYGVGLDYANGVDDTVPNLRPLLHAVAELWRGNVEPGGFCLVNFADIVAARTLLETGEPCEYPMAVEYWSIFRAAGWLLHTRRVWAKRHGSVSAPWTSNSNRAACDWEHLWTWKRPGSGLNERRQPSYLGVWDTGREAALEVGKDAHPAGFPTMLPRWAIEIYTNPGDLIVDPFGGTGTTLIAAEQTERPCRMMELSPAYCDLIRQRYATFVGRPELATAPAVDRIETGPPPAAAAPMAELRFPMAEGLAGDVGSWLEICRRELDLPDGSESDVLVAALRRVAQSF
jgi:DNA modification methylase